VQGFTAVVAFEKEWETGFLRGLAGMSVGSIQFPTFIKLGESLP
jgi:hypothetical protein